MRLRALKFTSCAQLARPAVISAHASHVAKVILQFSFLMRDVLFRVRTRLCGACSIYFCTAEAVAVSARQQARELVQSHNMHTHCFCLYSLNGSSAIQHCWVQVYRHMHVVQRGYYVMM